DVEAQVEAQADGRPAPRIWIEKVVWPAQRQKELVEKRVMVTNLPEVTDKEDWQGPGPYILALEGDGEDYRLVRTPRSPGFFPLKGNEKMAGPLRIYPRTEETLKQLATIAKPRAADRED